MALASRIAERVAAIRGVEAVALGGSWARGDADPRSDIDLGIYYRPSSPPDLVALRELAAELDPAHGREAVTEIGGWGPWINGGAWLAVEDRSVDWIYRDLDLVEAVIADCLRGRTDCHYQPGHPHGFHTHMYLGEVADSAPLHDASGVLEKLKAQSVPYPPALKRRIVELYVWEAAFALNTAEKAAARNDTWYVAGALFRSVACLVQVLFALNERYFTNEKGAIARIEQFPRRPREFGDVVRRVFVAPGRSGEGLARSLAEVDRMAAAVEALAAEPGGAGRGVASTE